MESLGKRLHEAAIEGNVRILSELLQQDPLLLDRVNLNDLKETPIHVAALLGHVDFVDAILRRRPLLAKELDSNGSSPLHVAAAKGFLNIVRSLLKADVDMCSFCNKDGRNPLHLAAMRGHLDVLAELVKTSPVAARATVDNGGTVLHLCVKYNQLEALTMLIETLEADDSFLNAKDSYGFTILHLAVSNKQLQTVQYLISHTGIKVNEMNSNRLAALDILAQSERDFKDLDIADTLRAAGAIRTTEVKPPSSANAIKKTPSRFWWLQAIFGQRNDTWQTQKLNSVMVVASLIATMAFQAGVSPPGGVWQANGPPGSNQIVGKSVMAVEDLRKYKSYLSFNSTGFAASVLVILLLVTGLPFKHHIFVRILIVTMWIAVCSMAVTYGISIAYFTPKESDLIVFKIYLYVSLVTFATLAVFTLGKFVHLLSEKVNTHMNTRKPRERRVLQA